MLKQWKRIKQTKKDNNIEYTKPIEGTFLISISINLLNYHAHMQYDHILTMLSFCINTI